MVVLFPVCVSSSSRQLFYVAIMIRVSEIAQRLCMSLIVITGDASPYFNSPFSLLPIHSSPLEAFKKEIMETCVWSESSDV